MGLGAASNPFRSLPSALHCDAENTSPLFAINDIVVSKALVEWGGENCYPLLMCLNEGPCRHAHDCALLSRHHLEIVLAYLVDFVFLDWVSYVYPYAYLSITPCSTQNR